MGCYRSSGQHGEALGGDGSKKRPTIPEMPEYGGGRNTVSFCTGACCQRRSPAFAHKLYARRDQPRPKITVVIAFSLHHSPKETFIVSDAHIWLDRPDLRSPICERQSHSSTGLCRHAPEPQFSAFFAHFGRTLLRHIPVLAPHRKCLSYDDGPHCGNRPIFLGPGHVAMEARRPDAPQNARSAMTGNVARPSNSPARVGK